MSLPGDQIKEGNTPIPGDKPAPRTIKYRCKWFGHHDENYHLLAAQLAGFRTVGVMPEAGFKLGCYLDVIIIGKMLDSFRK